MMQLQLNIDGFDCGPLFAPPAKRRPPKPRMQSTYRDQVLREREPPWCDRGAVNYVYKARAFLQMETGIRYSVDHIVPVNHPLVCGLHVANNLMLIPLEENIRKSNNWWPDMWGEQRKLL